MEMSEQEKYAYVKQRWEKCYKYQSLSGVQMIQFGPHSLHTIDEVYDFTRERERQIREVEEEIALIRRLDDENFLNAGEQVIIGGILGRSERALAELKKGLKHG